MSNELQNYPPYPSYVIRSCQLCEMSNEEQDTPHPNPPNLGHQELEAK